jgi:hypothetical protein
MPQENKWLQEILGVGGVEGVMLASPSGKLIAKAGLNFDHQTSEKIAEKIIRIRLLYQQTNQILKEIEIIWQDYNLVIMLKKELILITYCSQNKNLPLLRITLHVMLAHMLEDKKFIKQIKKHMSEIPTALASEQLEAGEIKLISKLQ